MLSRRNWIVMISAFLFGCASIAPAPSPDADRRLSTAIERALPPLVSSGDHWSASRLYFQLAAARSRMNKTAAACAALARSLAHYRSALAADTALFEVGSDDAGDDEGMQEIRSGFGCAVAPTPLEARPEPRRGLSPFAPS